MGVPLSYLAVTQLSVLAQASEGLIQLAVSDFRSRMFIESIGIFWITAEIVILMLVVQAKRVLDTEKVPLPRLRLEGAGGWAAFSAGAVILVAALTFGRHLIIEPMPRILERTIVELSNEDLIVNAYTIRATIHTVVWSIFVTTWVALEVAIVFQGYRAYKNFARLFNHAQAK